MSFAELYDEDINWVFFQLVNEHTKLHTWPEAMQIQT